MKTLFCLQPEFANTREAMSVIRGCRALGWDYVCKRECPSDAIPVGSVEYCEQYLPKADGTIDFFPYFLRGHLHRRMELAYRLGEPDALPTFYKDATRWKSSRWTSRVVPAGEKVPEDILFYQSTAVLWEQEWRYYVADRVVLSSGWYDGQDDDEPAPPLPYICWPDGYCGAVDFGRFRFTENGQTHFALVEAHAPFACGWYGEDHLAYTMWLAEGWAYWQANPFVFRLPNGR